MSRIILPKIYVEKLDHPLIFLAGPIMNAPKWQYEAIELIISADDEVLIASPTRELKEDLKKYLIPGIENYFHRQREWERHYLDIASQIGAIMFWLPAPAVHTCDVVYGAMTRIELGQWMTNYRHDKSVRFCVGTDGNFPGFRTIVYDLLHDALGKDVKGTLEDTCKEAIRLANQLKLIPYT
ncbi:MAG TPA: hypothetical protein VJ461_00595 [Candidatus Nanoarchaeia archaeon]|nr:hypothetical protein [Candidatus Nanoarchaeia archaeon]